MNTVCLLWIFSFTVHLVSSAGPESPPPQYTALLQQNPSFQSFLTNNSQINQLLLSNPNLVDQFLLNPNLIRETQEHAKFLNAFLAENANLPQIIQGNPNVYGFILKQVDHAVQSGEDKTIVIQMTEADMREAQQELQAAQQAMKVNSQNVASGVTGGITANEQINTLAEKAKEDLQAQQVAKVNPPVGSGVVSGSGNIAAKANKQMNAYDGLSREELIALLSKNQGLGLQSQLTQPGPSNNYAGGHGIVGMASQPPAGNGVGVASQALSAPSKPVVSTSGLSLFNSQRPSGFGLNSIANEGTLSNVAGVSGVSTVSSDMIDLNNMEDLIKLRALYIVMYNTQPKSTADLTDFYNNILAKLNVRTRQQVSNYLGRFKIVSEGQVMSEGQTSQSGWNEGPVNSPQWTNQPPQTAGHAPKMTKHKWIMSACKARIFCRKNPDHPMCDNWRKYGYANQGK